MLSVDNRIDFESINNGMLSRLREVMPDWLPGGKMQGKEYVCSNLRGGPGSSFSVNTETGAWADFAGDVKGGDPVSLWAAIQGIGQVESAKELLSRYAIPQPRKFVDVVMSPPPNGAGTPTMHHFKYGSPSNYWEYKNANGENLFYISRYDTPEGKQILPWSWDKESSKWIMKGHPVPRPLYGLELLASRLIDPVLIVEGEKAAEAARKLIGDKYVVMTWPNGSKAVNKSDWSPLRERNILIWPDADNPGISAGYMIASLLKKANKSIRILDVKDMPSGFDAADALAEGWDKSALIAWAKPRAKDFKESGEVVISSRAVSVDTDTAAIKSEDQTVIMREDDITVSGSLFSVWEKLGIALTQSGSPICNVDNALRILENYPGFKDIIWFDEFHQKYFTKWKTKKAQEWSDVDTINLLVLIQRKLGMTKMSDEMVRKATSVFAHQHTRNEPRDWMDSLAWDGTHRISRFLIDCLGVEETEYSKAASRNFFVGMCARVKSPGCQLDNMIILEGGQGKGKTKALRILGGEWYAEAKESVHSNDFFMALHGKILIEIAELNSFGKAEITRIKQVVTSSTDRYRAPYGRTSQDHKRMCVFAGSTNENTYLKDSTGGRRFWPMRTSVINLEAVHQNRAQLFAEAVHAYNTGEKWYEMPDAETLEMQESRRERDEWEPLVAEYLSLKIGGVQIANIANECLRIEPSRLDLQIQRRIGNILRAMKWERRSGRLNGNMVRAWYPEKEFEP